MDIQYPQRFIEDSKHKKVFFIKPPEPYLNDCPNCGGIGHLSAFYVSKGPFINVPPTPREEILKSMSDSQYGWFWYTGKDFTETCPVCDGLGSNGDISRKAPLTPREFEEMNPLDEVKRLAKEKRIKKIREPWQMRKDIA